MARHSNGLKNYAIAPSIFAAVIVLSLILVGGVWWFMKRDQASLEHQGANSTCIEGEVKLPVSNASTAVLQQFVTDYAASKPIVKDHCVKIEYVQDIDDAALVFLSGDVEGTLEAAKRSATSSTWPVAQADPLGIAYEVGSPKPSGKWDALKDSASIYAPASFEGKLAAAFLGNVRGKPYQIVTATTTPKGMEFYQPEDTIAVPIYAIALNPAGNINEDQTRAATDFASFVESAEKASFTLAKDELITQAQQATVDVEVELPTGTDTLVLLDTSENMQQTFPEGETFFAQTIRTLDPLLRSVGREGGKVALWNYSSPLSQGVNRAWRANVEFSKNDNGTASVEAMQKFGTGGTPKTREALEAAIKAAADQAREKNTPVRLVLLTTGTQDAEPSTPFSGMDNVILDIIHLGQQPVDSGIAEWATTHGGSATTAGSIAELETALNASFGTSSPIAP
ncbi:VWA domain-containing protein [Corynebacterium freiburgense]|uniref:VWA domain-containing protein n=1 Tax=Corynebacterium freiburgense TaxID=556548 RepID=UPI0003FE9A9D|nr:VWA domain-containing protein [Corynebacterium freiburgense]WJZ02579.1 von Willebrand factor type A domain protein [Corynebacterium freiburgense]